MGSIQKQRGRITDQHVRNVALFALTAFYVSVSITFSAGAIAAETSDEQESETAPNQTVMAKLAEHPAWLNLLHYRPNGDLSWRSESDQQAFFLSPHGATDPYAEMLAVSKAMKNVTHDDDSVFCRFPARTRWLGTQLGMNVRARRCTALDQWKSRIPTHKMSIVFVSSYLRSPASMFGHTFLRFQGEQLESRDLLSATLNFTADATAATGTIDYIRHGLFGGFPGRFDSLSMFRRLRTYSDNEGRDLWEYELAFTREEIELVIEHAWEIRDSTFDYLFLSENCSYRTLSLLAVAKPDSIDLRSFARLAIPIETVRLLKDRHLVTYVRYWPSTERSIKAKLRELPKAQKRLLRNKEHEDFDFKANEYASLPDNDKANLLDTGLQYLALRIYRGDTDLDGANKRYFALLQEASIQRRPSAPDPDPSNITDPSAGHRQRRAGISIGKEADHLYTEGSFRVAGHGTEDPLDGYQANASLEFLNLRVRAYQDATLVMQRFDFVTGTSQQPFEAFFPKLSWNFNLSRRRKDIHTEHDNTTELGLGFGVSNSILSHVISLVPSISVDNSSALANAIEMDYGVRLGLHRQVSRYAYRLDYEYRDYLSDSVPHRTSISGEFAYFTSGNGALVAGLYSRRVERQVINAGSLGYRHFF